MSGDSYVIDLTQLIQQLLQQTPTQTQTQTTTPTQTSTPTQTQTPTTTTTTQTSGQGVFYLARGDPTYGSKVIRFLEEAYAYYKSLNLRFAPPCKGDKYPVFIEDIEFGADVNVGSCIERIRVDVGLNDLSLRKLAYHELAHIVRFGMGRDVNGAYSWFSEAIPEAVAYSVVKTCVYAAEYFTKRLWKVNPYQTTVQDWYRYSAAFLWHLERGASVIDMLSADQQRAERYYIEFLKNGVTRALEGGIPLCGALLNHRDKIDDEISLAQAISSLMEIPFSLPPLTAMYIKVANPYSKKCVLISVPSGIESNFPIGRPFWFEGSERVLAVVNASATTKNGRLILQVRPDYECGGPTPTQTSTPTQTRTPTQTPTTTTTTQTDDSYTIDLTQLIQQLLQQTPTQTQTQTPTQTWPTWSPTQTYTPTWTPTYTYTPTWSPTQTYTPTQTGTQGGICPQGSLYDSANNCTVRGGSCIPGTYDSGYCCCAVQISTYAPTQTQEAESLREVTKVLTDVLPLLILVQLLNAFSS